MFRKNYCFCFFANFCFSIGRFQTCHENYALHTLCCSLVSAEVVTTRLGGVARFNCSAPTGGSVEWKRKLPKEFSYIYVHPWLHKPYDTGGRHNVSLDPLTGAGDLVITNVTDGDAGKYYCTETIGRIETHFELVVLLGMSCLLTIF